MVQLPAPFIAFGDAAERLFHTCFLGIAF